MAGPITSKAVRAQLALERVKKKLPRRRKEAEEALAQLRRLPVTGPNISDDDLYDTHGLPK
jgi:hypothetical protein